MPELNDELDSDFVAARAGAEAVRLRGVFESYKKTIKRPTPQTPESTPASSGVFSSIVKDIGGGLRPSNFSLQVLGGARDAVQGTLNAVDSVADWMNENVVDLDKLVTGKPAQVEGSVELPNVPEAETNTGNLVRGATQFLVGFGPTLKLVRGMTGGAAASGLGRFAQAEAAAALTSAVVFDPHEERLSNLLNEVPILENPVFEYLAASPEDTEVEGRLKSALEGLGLGIMAEGVLRGVRAIKANRTEKGVTPGKFTAIRATEQPTDAGAVSYDIMDKQGKDVGFAELTIEGDTAYVNMIDSYAPEKVGEAAIGGPNKLGTREMRDLTRKLVEDYPQIKFISGERISGSREKSMIEKGGVPGEEPLTVVPVSRFTTRGLAEPEEPVSLALGHPDEPFVTPAKDEQVTAYLESGQLPFSQPFQFNWTRFSSNEDIELALNDTVQIFSGKINEARRGKMTEEAIKSLAEKTGLTIDDILNARPGRAYTAEEIYARKTMVEASQAKLDELTQVARKSTDPKDKYDFARMLNIHAAVLANLQGAGSEAGRSLRALQMIASGSIEKQLSQINEALMRFGGPDQVGRLAEAISQINDPAQIARLARGSMGRRLTDAVVEAWYFALLSGPQTHVVNFISNGLNTLWQVPERALAAQIGALRGTQNGVQAGEATAMLYGLMGSLRDAVRLAGRSAITGEASAWSKAETRVPAAITSEKFPVGNSIGGPLGSFLNYGVDGFGTFVRLPTRALLAADEFYQTIGRSMQMNALAYRKATQEGLEGEAFARRIQELMAHPSNAMIESAQAFSSDLTFSTKLGEKGQSIQNFTNTVPATKFVLPFTRTPANIFKWTGRRSVLAPLASGIRQEIKRGGPEADLAVSRIVMGSSLAAITADFAVRGYVTGAGPSDPDLRQTWLRTHQPYSMLINGNWYSYNRLDPFGLLAGASASYAEIASYSDAETLDEYAFAIAIATSRSVFNKTWMRGPAEFADMITSNEEDKYEKFLQRFTGSLLVPATVAQSTRVVDPVWREVNSIGDAIRARTPGYSDELPASRNLWGQKILLEGGLGPDIVSPIYKSQDEDRPIDEWMLENRVNAKMPGRAQMDAELTPKQYERFVSLAGNELKDPHTGLGAYDTMNAIMAGTHPQAIRWGLATDGPEGGRALILHTHLNAFRELARAKLYEEDAEFRSRVQRRAIEKGRAIQQTNMSPTAGRAP